MKNSNEYIKLLSGDIIDDMLEQGFYRSGEKSVAKTSSKMFTYPLLVKFIKTTYEKSQADASLVATFLMENLEVFPDKNEADKFDATSLELWLEDYLTSKEVVFKYDQTVRKGSQIVDLERFYARLRIDAEQAGFVNKDGAIADHMILLRKDAEDRIQGEHRDKLSFSETLVEKGDKELRKFLLGLKGGSEERLNLDMDILKHFIWQIKRKLWKKPVKEHIMPVFVGATGAGKSYNLLKLLEPIEELTYQAPSMTMLNDEREAFLMQQYFCVIFDELSGADRVEINRLKQYITADKISYRILGKNMNCTGKQNSTFVATSNTAVKRAIIDPTSARRYWQVDCGHRDDVMPHWNSINQIDFEVIWRSVDEESDIFPIKGSFQEIGKIQTTEFRAQTILEQFCEDKGIAPFKEDKENIVFQVGMVDFYNDFKEWCEDLKRRLPLQKATFEEMKNLEYQMTRRNRGSVILFYAPKDYPDFEEALIGIDEYFQ